MVTIKDEKKFIESANRVFNQNGTPKELAKELDNAMFEIMRSACNSGVAAGEYEFDMIATIRDIRDLFIELDHNNQTK